MRRILNKPATAVGCAVMVLLINGPYIAPAHQGERIIPVFEITDDMLELINVQDGSIEEWEELFEPSLTALDFHASILDSETLDWERASYDPSDLDFRMWLGWNATENRLYGSLQAADDYHAVREKILQRQDAMYFGVDGDHSGGTYRFFSGERVWDSMGQAQEYAAPSLWDMDRSVGLLYDPEGVEWVNDYPYADGGEAAVGESPVVWTLEFFVTPFDALIRNDQENSVVSALEAGKVIGLFFLVVDIDRDLDSTTYMVDDGFLRGGGNPNEDSSYWIDGFLLGKEVPLVDSAVRSSSWGMIKASLGH